MVVTSLEDDIVSCLYNYMELHVQEHYLEKINLMCFGWQYTKILDWEHRPLYIVSAIGFNDVEEMVKISGNYWES